RQRGPVHGGGGQTARPDALCGAAYALGRAGTGVRPRALPGGGGGHFGGGRPGRARPTASSTPTPPAEEEATVEGRASSPPAPAPAGGPARGVGGPGGRDFRGLGRGAAAFGRGVRAGGALRPGGLRGALDVDFGGRSSRGARRVLPAAPSPSPLIAPGL